MRVALYARVSTQEQAQHGLSIGAQIAALEEWAKPYTIVGEYIDAGISARSPISKRPELQSLLRNLDNVDLIVFTKLDRWTRNIREYYKAQDVLEAHGVAWRAIHEDYETETAAGRLKVNIMLSVAQDEADRTSERIKAVFADKRRRGLVTGSPPFGLKLVNGKYEKSEEAPLVKELFDRYIATRSSTFVARQFGKTPEGIRFILRNKTLVEQGVIDEETFEIANAVLQSRSQRQVRTDRVYLFSGICRCGKCGAALAAVFSDNCVYYRCPRHYNNGPCEGVRISEKKLEKYLLENIVEQAEEMNLTITKKSGRAPDVGKLTARLNKLSDMYLNDLITAEKYEQEYRTTQKAIEDAQKRPKLKDTEEIVNLLGAYKGLSKAAKKAFWCRLVRKITINGNIEFELY